jgi:predicted LPLAT superfamily acyltransferase
VPVYNHAATLSKVLTGLKALGYPILVVNDGSSDVIAEVLAQFPEIEAAHHRENRGKGAAIATGMRYASDQGYHAILTFDADGQHFPQDVPDLIAVHEQKPEALILGARDFTSSSSGDIPGSSKFGRSFSNFWIWTECGRWLDDTQTGLRVYPVDLPWLETVKGHRYSFEVEAITRMVWQGRDTVCVPVSTFYPKRGERISHFHALWDNFWITKAHTRLVILNILRLLGLYRPLRLPIPHRPEVKGVNVLAHLIRVFGVRGAYAVMIFPVLWSFATRTFERRALLQFYRRCRPDWGRGRRALSALRNFLQFAASIVDRTNPDGAMLVESRVASGQHGIHRALPQGAILLGAHYGDWALIAKRIKPFLSGPLGLVADPTITPKFFHELQKRLHGKLRVINSRQDVLGFALSVKEVIDEGGNVAFLADRANLELDTLPCVFLGELRAWPRAPFLIASRLGAPVVFVSAVKDGVRARSPYFVEYEELTEGRSRVGESELLQRYVNALEKRVRAKPQHWFNFFPFW